MILFYEQAGSGRDDYPAWEETVWSNKKGRYAQRTVRWTAGGTKQMMQKCGNDFKFVAVDSDDDQRKPVSKGKRAKEDKSEDMD